MIQYLLLQNRQGKTRLSKYYRPYTDDEKHKLEGEIHRLVTTRDPKFTNFVEARPRTAHRAPTRPSSPPACTIAVPPVQADLPPICRAVLHTLRGEPCPALAQAILAPLDEVGTVVPQDTTDNELMYFESIHLFVELL